MQNVINPTNDIIERLKQVQGYRSDAELARDLGVPPKKLAVWKLRNTIPLGELTSFCRRYGFNLEWVLTGEGVTRRPQPSEVREPSFQAIESQRKLNLITKKIERLLEEMTDDQRRDVLKYVEERKLLAELLEERKKGK